MRTIVALMLVVGLCAAAFTRTPSGTPHVDAWTQSHPLDSVYLVLTPRRAQSRSVLPFGSIVQQYESDTQTLVIVQGQTIGAIQSVYPNAIISANQRVYATDIPAPWNLDRLDEHDRADTDGTWSAPTTGGAGIHIYMVDSGIDVAHPDFGGRADTVFSAYTSTADGCGHGTHTADTAGGYSHGVARGASIHSVKVLTDSCSGALSDLAAGLLYVSQAGVSQRAIVSMSLGFGSYDAVIGSLIAKIIKNGNIVVAAAGNDGTTACGSYPAAYPGVVSVAASTELDAVAAFSNWGSCVDIVAPGVNVEAAAAGTAGYRTLSGTSMATPHISGIAALLWHDHLQWSSSQVAQAVISTATTGALTNLRGSPDRLAFWSPDGTVTAPSPSRAAAGSGSGVITTGFNSGVPSSIGATRTIALAMLLVCLINL